MSMNDRDISGITELSSFLERLAGLVDFQGIKPARVSERSILGDAPLHFAARWGDQNAGKILLEAGANPNLSGENGYTPLHNAIEGKHLEFTRLLLAHGASKERKNDDGLTAVDLAKLSDDPRLTAAVVDTGPE